LEGNFFEKTPRVDYFKKAAALFANQHARPRLMQ